MKIKLDKNKKAIIDNEDYKKIKRYKWYAYLDCGNFYARVNIYKNGKWKTILMHRLIINAKKGEIVDHINMNTLDNRKKNLRIVNNQQNNIHKRGSSKSKSKYKGVTWIKKDKRWRVYITYNKKTYYGGQFKKEIDAARAYNKKAKELFGEYAFLNKI